MREIITLQLGQRANYLATHFWNLQESYFTYDEEESPVDHDVLFRSGTGADGSETYTPRTLIYDLKGAFGTLRKYNALYQLSEDVNPGQGLWDGREIIQQQPSIPQSDYQKNLDAGLPAPPLSAETVRYWSDYNRLFYHPRSILQLNDYELNSKVMPFEDWEMGEELFNNIDKEHDLLDRDVRPFAEECDQMRGLQIFAGSDDAWGGFTAKYVDRLRDEYGKKAMWVWAIEDGAQVDRQARNKRDINKARSLHSIAPQSSLYTPIIDPPSRLPGSIHLNHRSQWYTSALISCALESVTLPTRLRAYHAFEASLAGDDSSHNIFELQSTIIQNQDKYRQQHPVSAGVSEDTDDRGSHPAEAQTKFDIDFTYDGFEGERPHVFNQLLVMRGIESPEDESPSYEDTGLQRKKRHYDSQPMFQSFDTPLKLPILDSFPQDMFREAPPDRKLGVLTGLTTSSRTAEKIKLMETVARRIISIDERETIINGLGEIRETYETGWMSGSDSDDE
ncbi:tubulin nucleotide-binding domain-like protein [Aspergillus campestris IBT 28561]|uniref:Protein DML1 n=1 Tax=Aspergillus campestris (strain IBT 28561) TaxID=1392248 RepID=A0A2I1DGU0_ASPC2|nr:tubulin nucleotide-binding domain-like protein [Aspergillus campestris IBT 28561]PKY09086.1 tubulin nucleotide-binding domain-like protein [Aspergillus campestris IBT 28561]